MQFLKLSTVICLSMMIFGCGDGGGGSDVPVTVDSITLSGDTFLEQFSSTEITATVIGSNGRPIADGTEVLFTSTDGYIDPSAKTAAGTAKVTFLSNSAKGKVTITASAGELSESFILTVNSGAVTILLETSLPPGSDLAQNGQTSVTAKAFDINGLPVVDGTEILFTATTGFITGAVATVDGKAIATYSAPQSGGIVEITATSGDASSSLDLKVASGPAAWIELVSITPDRLGLKGSGVDEFGTIVFNVKDGGGNPVADGRVVTFSLKSTTGGGEYLSPQSAPTAGGKVSVSLISGDTPGVATVTASTQGTFGTVSTEARITMGYGKPDQRHISLAFEKLNVAGGVIFGLENTLIAYVADRYSNPVPENTPVYFASECGIVALTDSLGTPLNFTNKFGIAGAKAITADPVAADGLCTTIMWTEGEEAYDDRNGNGRYDSGEVFYDLGEPYIDANGNGSYDVNEIYFDVNGNGRYTPANGVWDGDTFVWTAGTTRWSDNTATPVIDPQTFEIMAEGSQSFVIYATDINGGPLPAGSKVTVSESCARGSLSGDTSVTIPDAVYPGNGTTVFNVLLSSNTAIANAGTPLPCSLTVSVTASPNGNRTNTINGALD